MADISAGLSTYLMANKGETQTQTDGRHVCPSDGVSTYLMANKGDGKQGAEKICLSPQDTLYLVPSIIAELTYDTE